MHEAARGERYARQSALRYQSNVLVGGIGLPTISVIEVHFDGEAIEDTVLGQCQRLVTLLPASHLECRFQPIHGVV